MSKVHPRNDGVGWIRGVVDDLDPINADGSPKWINNATVTWQLRTAEDPASGVVMASGSGVAVGSGGAYYCQLSDTIAILPAVDYYLHIVVTTPSGDVADLVQHVPARTRTGATDIT